jgi:hypothetical protein
MNMKKFIAAAFHITLFQVLLFLSLAALKYWMGSSGLDEHLKSPLVISGMGVFLLLITALSIGGYLENKGYTVESWVAARPDSKLRIWIAQFIQWGQVLPIAFGYLLILYIITPTSLTLFIALFAGIVFRNIIEYKTKKKDVQSETSC